MSFQWNDISKQRMLTLQPVWEKVLNRLAEICPYQLNLAQAGRTADEEMGLWLECHNPDGSRKEPESEFPWKTNCNGYPVGTVAPNGVKGTGESNHQGGFAVDLAVIIDGEYCKDITKYHTVAAYMEQARKDLGLPEGAIIYGGTWPPKKTDSDHWELNRQIYPATGTDAA